MDATSQQPAPGLWPSSWASAAANLCKRYERYRVQAILNCAGQYLQGNLRSVFGTENPASGLSLQPALRHGKVVYEMPGTLTLAIARNNHPSTHDCRAVAALLEKQSRLAEADYVGGLKIEIIRHGETDRSVYYLSHVRTDRFTAVYEHNLNTVRQLRDEILYGRRPSTQPKPVARPACVPA